MSRKQKTKNNGTSGNFKVPYSWTGGVVTEMSKSEKEKLSAQKRCALCGRRNDEKSLTYERLSGARHTYLCEDCALDYLAKAEACHAKYEKAPSKQLALTVFVDENNLQSLKSVILDWANREGVSIAMEGVR